MCDNCKFKEGFMDNITYDKNNSVKIRRYQNQDSSYSYYLVLGQGCYDEYDSYDIETQICFCPTCGEKLGGE